MLCCYFINYHRCNYHLWNINNAMKQTHTHDILFVRRTNEQPPSLRLEVQDSRWKKKHLMCLDITSAKRCL